MIQQGAGQTQPPTDRYCDLVMKGGITSGVIYPTAIGHLSKHYRFRSIGGTSAGAIAAVVTAAAEYQRRHTNSDAGFARLERLPQELGEHVGAGPTSKLLSLFQPQPQTRRLFSVLIGALNASTTNRRILAIVLGFMRAYWPATATAGVLAVLIGLQFGWVAGGLTAILATTVAVGFSVYQDISRGLVDNRFGLCTGLTEPACEGEALTPWLHSLIQEAAGRRPEDAPLTFGDLWDAPGFPPPWLRLPPDAKPRSIDLQVFSTNLTHGRPYIFPLRDNEASNTLRVSERLFFRPEELERCLPPQVMQWMRDRGLRYRLESGRENYEPAEDQGQGLLELPAQRDMPVLLAARMSLSFPLLFSAVPLWAIDYDMLRGERCFRRCWFSDGGISSNFPMHLFDGLVPMWPTFGITLEPEMPKRAMVYLPQAYREGYGERWNRFDDDKKPGISRFGGFLGSIVATMQNWNDNALSRMPGVRDRVVRVRLHPHEGGMNLNMEPEVIKQVADRGIEAASSLLALFAEPPKAGAVTNGWDDHRLVRLNVLLKLIEARAPAILSAIDGGNPHVTDFGPLIRYAQHRTAPGYEKPLSDDEAELLRQQLAELRSVMANIAMAGTSSFAAVPEPEMRVRPSL